MKFLSETPISQLNIGTRASNSLKAEGIETLAELLDYGFVKVQEIPNLGSYSNAEIWSALSIFLIKKISLMQSSFYKNHELQITTRDYFAAKAMQGFASTKPPPSSISQVAQVSYEWADEMLKVKGD